MQTQQWSGSDAQVSALKAVLQQGGAMVLKQFPLEADHASLKQLAQALGTPLLEAHNTESGMICPVEVETQTPDTPYANTPLYFPCHSDCSDFPEPPDVVILLCERQAGRGGESLLAAVDDIAQRLNPADIMAMQRPDFLFRHTQYPILFIHQGALAMRYNRMMIELFQRVNDWPENSEQQALFDRLDAAAENASQRFCLEAGDCFILNNYRLLHGRSAFEHSEDKGKRLLQRVRLTLKC